MKPIHIHLKGKQIQELKRLSVKDDTPVARLIRRAIDEFIAKRKYKESAKRKEM